MGEQDANLEPMDVIEDNSIVQAAKDEAGKLDVLICGGCHEVFHFVEELKEHRLLDKCAGKSVLTEEQRQETKHQIWAFTLWKSAKFKNKDDELSNWTIFQQWCDLEQPEKEKWIIAAQKVQYLHKLSIIRTVEKKNIGDPKGKIVKIKTEDLQNAEDTEMELNEPEVKPTSAKPPEKRGRGRPPLKPNRGVRTSSTGKSEYNVEKITAKRYQPKIKGFEYLIKWENFDNSENTWEPVSHLAGCKRLVDEFERKLEEIRKQKAAKLMKSDIPNLTSSGGRPIRSSKARAMNQVKQWVGTISDHEDTGSKRIYSDSDDSDEGYEKRLKMEAESSDSDEKQPQQITIKKLSRGLHSALNNGANGAGSTRGNKQHESILRGKLPDNILVPDANGIVRINQKQLPNLSTGVYVMSKTAGIIKLDSDTSKIAASGGHAVIKVAPRIGQTSIKIIRKDAQNGGKITTTTTKVPNVHHRQSTIHKLNARLSDKRQAHASAISLETSHTQEDEESDGLEDLEFPPPDAPIPEEESPPGDFVLCPLTGKIAGKEYPTIEEVQQAQQQQQQPSAGLDNLVNIAAAEILQDAAEAAAAEDTTTNESTDEQTSVPSQAVQSSFKSSILSTALTNANIPTSPAPVKKVIQSQAPPHLISTPQDRRKVQQGINKGILNRTIPPRPSPLAVITRITPGSNITQVGQIKSGHRAIAGTPPRPLTRIIHQQPPRPHAPRMNPRPQSTNRILVGNSAARPGPGALAIQQRTANAIANQRNNSPQQQQHTTTTVRRVIRTPSQSSQQQQQQQQPQVMRRPIQQQQQRMTSPQIQHHGQAMVKTYVRQTPAQPKTVPTLVQQQTITTVKSAPIQQQVQQIQQVVSMPSIQTEPEHVQEVVQLKQPEEQPLLITGEDGTIYQVAGQNEDGQTILITQGEDGEQQCLLVASENMPEMNQAIAAAASNAEQQQMQQVVQAEEAEEAAEADESQVVAQIVSAQPPSPGGSRKVVLMLPDGSFMMTEVTADQYAALELDK